MEHTIANIASQIPIDLQFSSTLKFALILAAGMLFLGVLGYLIFGRRSLVNHAFSSAMGILFIYIVSIAVFSFNPAGLVKYLSPLPFVSFFSDRIVLASLSNLAFQELCIHLLSMVILAFLVNLLDTLMPNGESIITWYFCRFLTVIMAMALHFVVCWLFDTYMPNVIVTYAPIILLGILAATLLLGLCKVILGLVLTVTNPILGAIYTFFFSSLIGKQLTKSVLTTCLLCAVVYLLNHFGYTVILISSAIFGAYIPVIIILLILWYLIRNVF